jgi:hypothetical protein
MVYFPRSSRFAFVIVKIVWFGLLLSILMLSVSCSGTPSRQTHSIVGVGSPSTSTAQTKLRPALIVTFFIHSRSMRGLTMFHQTGKNISYIQFLQLLKLWCKSCITRQFVRVHKFDRKQTRIETLNNTSLRITLIFKMTRSKSTQNKKKQNKKRVQTTLEFKSGINYCFFNHYVQFLTLSSVLPLSRIKILTVSVSDNMIFSWWRWR